MINELLNIISKMNNGSILLNQANEQSERKLFNDDARLFVDDNDNKYYFFAEFIEDADSDNFEAIHKATIQNPVFDEERVNPSDAYLILFWNVEEINEKVYSDVIKIEENEMFYKKYVIYYTKEELNALKTQLDTYSNVSLEELIKKISFEEDLTEAWRLAIRIMTKIPFWILTFPSAIMEDFEKSVDKLIQNSSKKTDVTSLMELKHYISEEMSDEENLVDKIYARYLGDFD